MKKVKDRAATRQRFDDWSSTYERSFTWRYFFDPLHEALSLSIGDVKGAVVLDIGCGTGALLRRLAGMGAARLTGVDESDGMLEAARGLSGDGERFTFQKASAESLPFEDSEFDVVVSCVAFHHFPDPEGAITEACRVLKDGGRFYLCDLSGEGVLARAFLAYGRICATDTRYFDRETLRSLVEAAGLDAGAVVLIRRFPPTLLVRAIKPGQTC